VEGVLYRLCRKIIAEGGLDNGDGQADVHVKVRRLPNYDFRFIGRLQLQRNTKQGTERGMFWHKISLLCNGKAYRKQQRKATEKPNCYQKVIICA